MKDELKVTNEARGLVILEQFLKEKLEAKINKNMEELSLEMKINLECHMDDVHRIK